MNIRVMLILMLVLTGVSLVTMTGCGALSKTQTNDGDLQVLNEDEVAAAITGGKQVVLVDIRTAGEFAKGHLPGAIHMPIEMMGYDDPQLSSADQIIVYGDTFASTMSSAAAKKLLRLGYGNVYEFRGGVELWLDSGRSLVK